MSVIIVYDVITLKNQKNPPTKSITNKEIHQNEWSFEASNYLVQPLIRPTFIDPEQGNSVVIAAQGQHRRIKKLKNKSKHRIKIETIQGYMVKIHCPRSVWKGFLNKTKIGLILVSSELVWTGGPLQWPITLSVFILARKMSILPLTFDAGIWLYRLLL